MKLATVVIIENNEGEQVRDSLESLVSTSNTDLYDIIVVSDGSEIPPVLTDDVTLHVQMPIRKGVGAAIDVGVAKARTPYVFISGSDIRFRDNDYMPKMLAYLEDEANAKSIICTTNLAINKDKMDVNATNLMHRYGARICFFLTAEDLPQKGQVMARLKHDKAVPNYRNILEAKWLPKQGEGLYELPCVLGAFYGVRRDWYNHIGGFSGHRYWGTLEPLISLKSWFAGGECKIASDIGTAHIFKSKASHRTRSVDLIYNKLAASIILFEDNVKDILLDFLGTNQTVELAKMIYDESEESILEIRDKFREIKERDIYWFKEKFPFKDYDKL